MEGMMVAFYQQPKAAKRILRMIMDFQLAVAEHYLEVGVELVTLGDDLGTQSGALLSPAVVEEFLLPEYRRLCSLYRNNDVIISFHSCGHVEPLLDLFMELGVSVLNPVQATANDLAAVRRRTAGRLALQGGVRSATLVSGPPSAIQAEVAERIRLLGADGGYFCSPDQGMPWPEEHYRVFLDAVADFGVYPIGGEP
jgi:uroporphyrinogen decarboxylase